jgi:hypothetical protein
VTGALATAQLAHRRASRPPQIPADMRVRVPAPAASVLLP